MTPSVTPAVRVARPKGGDNSRSRVVHSGGLCPSRGPAAPCGPTTSLRRQTTGPNPSRPPRLAADNSKKRSARGAHPPITPFGRCAPPITARSGPSPPLSGGGPHLPISYMGINRTNRPRKWSYLIGRCASWPHPRRRPPSLAMIVGHWRRIAPVLTHDHGSALITARSGGGYAAAAVTSATTQAMLSGPPAALASSIRRWTTSAGADSGPASVSLMSAAGTTADRPSEHSR